MQSIEATQENIGRIVEAAEQIALEGYAPNFTVSDDGSIKVSRSSTSVPQSIIERDRLEEWVREWVAYDDAIADYYEDEFGIDLADELEV